MRTMGERNGEESRTTVTIENRQGLHARPAAEFVKLASRFDAKIKVRKDDLEVNGKSIMGVLMLAAEPGTELEIRASGPDAGSAVEALVELIRAGFPGDRDDGA
jgi:phosphocarrier protein